MGLFEDVVVNAKSAINVVGNKASKLVDISKLKINETEINNKISKTFEQLGKSVYNDYKQGIDSKSIIEASVKEADELYLQLDAVREQISLAKNKVKCKSCGYENEPCVRYCGGCGASLSCNRNDCECGNNSSDTVNAE